MWDFIVYLGESAISLAVLYLLYKATMSYETLHRFNRVVLLGVVVLAAVLPLCEIKIIEEVELLPLADVEGDVAMMSVVEDTTFDYVAWLKSLAVALFCLGAAFMVVRLVVSQLSVWRMTRSGARRELGEGVVLTVVDKLATPFSWFRNVVVAKSDAEQDLDLILEHELAHVRLRHSWDVLAVDIALCVWWFNPALWLLRRELQSLHEYQADDAVLRKGIDAKTYQILLIKRAVGSRLHSVANCLNHSNLKNRITMMCKKTSSRWSAAKLLLVLPLVAVSLAATATTVYVTKQQDKGNENFAIEQESENSTIRISDEKIYLNSEEIPFDELKERVQDFRQINLVADDGTTMGEVADVRSELRENPELKVNYLANDTVKINSTQHLTVKSVKSVPMEDLKKSDTIEMKSATGESIWVRYIGDGSSALVLIDGKEGNMEDLKVEDIEYFTVVKNEEALKAYGEKGKNGVILITTKNAVKYNRVFSQGTPIEETQQSSQEEAFIKCEKMPTFQGGDLNGYRNWFQSQLQYPQEAKEKGIMGRVIFSFVVEKDGSVSEFKVLNTPDKLLSAEVERVFKLTPKWEAGEQNGKKVRAKYTVPIVFNTLKSGSNAAA